MSDDPNPQDPNPNPDPNPADPNPADPNPADPDPNADPDPKGGKDPDPDPQDPKGGKSAAQGGDGGKKVVPTEFPEDWQAKIAGDDKDVAKYLARLGSPAALGKAYAEAQEKIRKGLKPEEPPAADASDDEKKAYREKMGLPADAEAYVKAVELPDGVSLGDDDKPIVEAIAKDFHEANIPASALSLATARVLQMQEEQAEAEAEADETYHAESIAELKQEMGGKYKANMNALKPYFDGFNEEMFDNLMGGRMADGSKIGDNPDAIRFFVAKALEENPAATVVPAGADQGKTIDEEIKALEKRMSEDRDGWFKDKPAQARYRELLDAQEKLSA